MFASKNSSDLDMGRRPELKSDEFCDANVIVHEIMSYEDLFTAEKVLHLFGALPRAASCIQMTDYGSCGVRSSAELIL